MRSLAYLLLLVLLAACAPAPAVIPPPAAVTSLPPAVLPTGTPNPTGTPLPLPSLTPAPTAAPTLAPTPTLAPVDFYDPAGCRRPQDEAGQTVEVNGWFLNERTLSMLTYAQQLYGGSIDLAGAAVTQGSYHDNGSLSFGTHLGGGAVDLSIFLPGTWQVDFPNLPRLLNALRVAGFAAWVRVIDEVYPGSGYHIHAVAVGDPQLSAEAEAQLTGTYGYFRGFDGLPREDGIPRADREGGPILCNWMRELGYSDLRESPSPAWPPADWRETLSKTGEQYVTAPGQPTDILAHNLYTAPEGLDQALAWGLWREAGLLPGIPSPARNLRPFLQFPANPGTFWSFFPPETYRHTRLDVSPARFDFAAGPLLPGDLLALASGSRTVLLVVTRVDGNGRAYAPMAVKDAAGWHVEMSLLFDPADPGVGVLRTVWGDIPGFDRLRPIGIGLPPGSAFEYTVFPGDALPALAARFHSTVEAVRRANPQIDPAHLPVGVTLTIPITQ